MNSESPRGTNSILILSLRTLPHLKGDWINFLTPFVLGISASYLAYVSKSPIARNDVVAAFGNLLQFNGALLGLLMAGFGLYSSVPTNQRTLIQIINAPKESRFSFFKMRLLTIYKMAFWSFSCTAAMLILYLLCSLNLLSSIEVIHSFSSKVKISISIGLMVLFQVKVIIELKIYVFSIYMRSMTEARMHAIENGKVPFDNSAD